jgi:hypothetical protein
VVKTQKPQRVARAFLNGLTEKKLIMLAMMCDAADEEIRLLPALTNSGSASGNDA